MGIVGLGEMNIDTFWTKGEGTVRVDAKVQKGVLRMVVTVHFCYNQIIKTNSLSLIRLNKNIKKNKVLGKFLDKVNRLLNAD